MGRALAAEVSSAMETEGLGSPGGRPPVGSSEAFPIRTHTAGLNGNRRRPESAARSRPPPGRPVRAECDT